MIALVLATLLAANTPAPKRTLHEELKWEADRYKPQLKTALAKKFIDAHVELPVITPRVLYREKSEKGFDYDVYFTEAERAKLPKERAEKLQKIDVDQERYYTTRYGTPLSYARPLDLLAEHGFADVKKKKILDFGFGYISHLRMLAAMGADARGVDVDPFLSKLYGEPGDQGSVKDGRVTLYVGRYPAEPALTKQVGGGYDLIISKNTLKRGYIHPERAADPKKLINLGTSDAVFLKTLHDALAPNGKLFIYNICPAQAPADQPFIPWADGRSPFTKEQFEKAGFKVITIDQVDDVAVRAMARAFGWDLPEDGEPGMDLEKDLFAWFTLAERS